MRLRIRYGNRGELVSDYEKQLVKGGLLVRVKPPEQPAQFEAVQLELVSPDGSVTLSGQVAQVFPGVGLAVMFAAPGPELAALVERARQGGDGGGPDAVHELSDAAAGATGGAEAKRDEAYDRVKNASTPEKVQMALHGSRDERALVLRDSNQGIHAHVLRNPGLQLDEVVAMAKMRTVSAELLVGIADKREWGHRPEIAIQLVRNPKTPVAAAVKLLDHVSAADLRQLAKDPNARQPIQAAARKKVLA